MMKRRKSSLDLNTSSHILFVFFFTFFAVVVVGSTLASFSFYNFSLDSLFFRWNKDCRWMRALFFGGASSLAFTCMKRVHILCVCVYWNVECRHKLITTTAKFSILHIPHAEVHGSAFSNIFDQCFAKIKRIYEKGSHNVFFRFFLFFSFFIR